MVEELLPAFVALMAEVNMEKGIVLRLYGLSDEYHIGLSWSSAGLFNVAFSTGTNDITPHGFAAHAPGDDMVER